MNTILIVARGILTGYSFYRNSKTVLRKVNNIRKKLKDLKWMKIKVLQSLWKKWKI